MMYCPFCNKALIYYFQSHCAYCLHWLPRWLFPS